VFGLEKKKKSKKLKNGVVLGFNTVSFGNPRTGS
jgi:hypothetical protein